MNHYEKDEIAKLPEKYRPMGAWKYFGYSILFALPLIGFICLIVFSFNSNNIVRRSYARSFFCSLLVIGIILGVVLVVALILGVSIPQPTPPEF
jgi:protein-S-isoprenylcysteine O-methyltransferase Ste14